MTTRVLLAGTGSPEHRQHHQRTMYLPAIRQLADQGFTVAGVWDLAGPGNGPRAADLAAETGAPLVTDVDSALATGPDLAVVCADPAVPQTLVDTLQSLDDAGVATLMDKPTLLDTTTLTAVAERFPAVVAGHPWRFHPALAGARPRVESGGIGRVRAVHGELLVGPTDGPHPLGELRNLGVHALDVVQSLIGDLRGRASAVVSPAGPDGAGEAITVSLRCEPDLAVTLLIGRAGGGTGTTARPGMVHRYRILGSHGQLLLDLDSPGMDVIGGTSPRVMFGPSAVAAQVAAVAAGDGQPGLAVAAALGGVLDALAESARALRAVDFGEASSAR
ncbi:Gfo/Idh/MocA family protein [Propionibacteriaceae bacterium Y1685]|uniref:Gfo/Idh/MocA family protein n=1 Tax=Microlunatus sp. Y1700 TaxID=3418487 RepID=UPI003B77956A